MRYHKSGPACGSASATASGAFREAVCRAAMAAKAAPNATRFDQQMIRDVLSKDARYGFRAVDRILDLLASLPDDAAAFGLVDDLREAVAHRRLRSRPWLALPIAVEQEAAAEAEANPVQLSIALHEQTPDSLRRAYEVSIRHRNSLDRLIDTIGTMRMRLAHGWAQ